ncbi:ABC transporter permease [Cellvibrio zantedeschiae]|uniref:ABC transporter permease n=1 Tax=Cellvibrio zantedeschiae TaxID=1237077 RepID=UPI0016777FBF|nr:ABC transporter permease [Cellvibrio zantedeschiae]
MLNIHNFKAAFYSLLKVKGYVITIVLTLGITLGALVAMFNLNYQLLAAPLPYPNPNELIMVQGQRWENNEIRSTKRAPYPALIEAYQQKDNFFSDKALVAYGIDVERSLPENPSINIGAITPEFLATIHAPLALGRHFNADEGLNAMVPVAILSFHTWEKLYQRKPDILDETVNFKGVTFKIVGVLARDFVEPVLFASSWQTDVWLPFDFNDIDSRTEWRYLSSQAHLVGRLKTNNLIPEAEHYFSSWVATRFKEETKGLAGFDNLSARFKFFSYKEVITGDAGQQGLLMLAGAITLLLIAAANITNLILARAANQQRAMAIQVALGAQKLHVFRSVFAEILLLMIGATAFAVVIAVSILEILKILAQGQLPRVNELHLNFPTILFAAICAFILAAVFSLIVSRQINYRALNSMLQTSGKGGGIQISQRIRNLLILSQVALTGILLIANLQILQESRHQLTQPLGFNTADTFQASLNMGTLLAAATEEERVSYLHNIMDELRANPKVLAVGIGSLSPVSYWTGTLSTANIQTEYGSTAVIPATLTWADESYLGILDIPLVAGNYYKDADMRAGNKVVVVNQTLAHRLQADGQVLGKQIFWAGSKDASPSQIVGIVKDIQLPGRAELSRIFSAVIPTEYPQLLIKVKPGQQLTNIELNTLMAKVNPQVKVFRLLTTEQARDLFTANQKTTAGLTATLAVLALGLAAIGIYGVLSYSVQLRRFELGIRMAIGARPAKIFIHILKDNVTPVMLGLLVAMLIAFGFWIWLEQSSYSLRTNMWGWCLPVLLIALLTAVTSLLSVWQIIRKPASFALRGE